MTPLTVWGTVAKVGETVAHYDTLGRLASAHTVREFDLDLPDDPIRVTARHSPDCEIGDLVHIELTEDDRLVAVAVLDDDTFADHGEPLFFSPDYIAYGTGLRSHTFTVERATITGLAVTPSPAGFAAKASPLKMMSGDLRDSLARFSQWPSSWRTNEPLLERAVDQLPRLRAEERRATHIVDRRMTAELREQMHYACAIEEHYRAHPGEIPPTNPGGLRHGPPGRVLSVR